MTSPELTGGAGFTYEDCVAATYLAAIISGTTATALDSRVVIRVAQQQAAFGEPLDDVIVDAQHLSDGSCMRLSIQVKRALIISSAVSNSDFRDVIKNSWLTIQKSDFRHDLDRVGVATSSVAEDTRRALVTVCEWARSSDSTAIFMQRFAKNGDASATHRSVIADVRKLAFETDIQLNDDQVYLLLKHFVLVKFDFLHEGSRDDANVLVSLQQTLPPQLVARALDLWAQLKQIARDNAGKSGVNTRQTLLSALTGWRFNPASYFAQDIQVIVENTRIWIDQQPNSIGDVHLERPELLDKLTSQISQNRLTLIKGLPGAGKTVLLHDFAKAHAATGTTLLLSSNRLTGRSWSEHARAIGISSSSIQAILSEVAATGHAILLIDGIDRISPEQQPIITDILGQLLSVPELSDWKIVATCREAGIEPLLNWIPSGIIGTKGFGFIEVTHISDEEAIVLSERLPALYKLLNSNDHVSMLARRPFFASVLARGLTTGAGSEFTPKTEVDILNAWWIRGGHDVERSEVISRQRALIELAKISAPELGGKLRIRDLSPGIQTVIPDLIDDGLVRYIREGHTLQFSHDIFFEWAFYHWMVDQGDDWLQSILDAGQLPALSRVVELLSQTYYSTTPLDWATQLTGLQKANVSPILLRAWLLAPVLSERFFDHIAVYRDILAADDHLLLSKLLDWFQAEKTTPNQAVLTGELEHLGELDTATRIYLADELGSPSDLNGWNQLIMWILANIETIPPKCFQSVIRLFTTWQNLLSAVPNPTSKFIIQLCAKWLHVIEDNEQRFFSNNRSRELIKKPEHHVPADQQNNIRLLLLRSCYSDLIDTYLDKIAMFERWSDKSFLQLTQFTQMLAPKHAEKLATIAKQWFMSELPFDKLARWKNEERHSTSIIRGSLNSSDRENLSIHWNTHGYFPSSPLREPFHSLLNINPEVGLTLIRDISNHATMAWRQLLKSDYRAPTPVPIAIHFPWGRAEFWGEDRHYRWFRGIGGPYAVTSAFMALEKWALSQLEAGRPMEELIRQLVDGHQNIAVLGIAVHLVLKEESVSPTTLALVSSIRLLRLDLARQSNEHELQEAGLIGFNGTSTDLPHLKQIILSNKLPSRKCELRDIIPLFALGTDQLMLDAIREATEKFPTNLELSYKEIENDSDYIAKLRETAELWAEYGKPEYYQLTPVVEQPGVFHMSMIGPKHAAPKIRESLEKHAAIGRQLELINWVQNSFKSKTLSSELSLDEAIARANELHEALVSGETSSLIPDVDLVATMIAGTAAAVFCFGPAGVDYSWADATVKYYYELDDEEQDDYSASAASRHHKIYVAYALAAKINSKNHQPEDYQFLLNLLIHPFNSVSIAAIGAILTCWRDHARFAWTALNLTLRLAQMTNRKDLFKLSQAERKIITSNERKHKLELAIYELNEQGPLPDLVRPLPYWTLNQELSEFTSTDACDLDKWEHSNDFWNSGYAAKVLKSIPFEAVMRSDTKAKFVDGIESLLGWTLDTVNPNWKTGNNTERGDGSLYEWMQQMSYSIGFISPYLSPEEHIERFLKPIFKHSDKIAMQLLAPITSALVCTNMDAPSINQDSLVLLQAILERMLQNNEFMHKSSRDRSLSGYDLPHMVQSFLLTCVNDAPGSTRFANGCWDGLEHFMPLIDRVIRAIGWHPYVVEQFTALCKRADDAYPTEIFADQIHSLIIDGELPIQWKGSSLCADIAFLIQEHSKRLHPLPDDIARKFMHILNAQVNLGDRRSAALQQSEWFRNVKLV